MQLCPPGRRSFVGDTLAGAQSDAKGAVGIDVTLRAASRQRAADRPLEYYDLVTELNDPELEHPGECPAAAGCDDVDLGLAGVDRPKLRPGWTASCERCKQHC